jgi:hypothetical protein
MGGRGRHREGRQKWPQKATGGLASPSATVAPG